MSTPGRVGVARALGRLFMLAGLERYAGVCSSAGTERIITAYADGHEEGIAAYTEAIEESNAAPPDTELLAWGSVIGAQERAAYHACAAPRGGAPAQSLWQRRHFVLAIIAQFCYVAAQTGIFSYFINYLTSDAPPLSGAVAAKLPSYMAALTNGAYRVTDRGAATLLSFGGFGLFLLGRITGSLALRSFKPHRMLAAYSAANVLMMLCVVLKLGWVSVGALFLSFFFMSISYPTIFALAIHDLRSEEH